MPGIDWGTLYQKYLDNQAGSNEPFNSPYTSKLMKNEGPTDLEHCFFVTHQKTGATCAVYRSVEQKLIVVSFRGTCAPIDLITDVTLVQDAWVEGEDINDPNTAKVHAGFRSSLNSIARRLKELILATPAPGENISQYDMLVTGHSLGGALATLFTADIGQYGIDAGRALPQLVDSEPWWKSIINTFMGQKDINWDDFREPPRPKSLRMYNFGSPRVGNMAFAELFDALTDEGMISEAFRIVNGEDVVARLPRTVNALVLGSVGYEHVGTTVLLSRPETASNGSNATAQPVLWIEGESDNKLCPVRDGLPLTSPLAEGTLLSDLINATRDSFSSDVKDESKEVSWTERLQTVAEKVTERIKNIQASDLASVLGIDQSFTDREFRIIQSLVQGKALAHHLEDEYYAGMGLASGFIAKVGEDLVVLDNSMMNFVPESPEEGTGVL
jgi:pimeloyl-ACP methyl ester carboxylesterase